MQDNTLRAPLTMWNHISYNSISFRQLKCTKQAKKQKKKQDRLNLQETEKTSGVPPERTQCCKQLNMENVL